MEQLVKYNNRKIYSRTLKKYVNLDYIRDLARTRQAFTVVKHKTGEELTNSVLKEALLSVTVSNKKLLDLIVGA